MILFVLNWFLSAPLYISLAKAQEEVDLWNFIWRKIIPKIFVSHSPNVKITQSLNFHNLDTHKSKNSKFIGIGFWIYIHQTLDCLIDMIYKKVWFWSFQFLSIITWKIDEIYKSFVNILNFLLIDCTIPTG